MKIVTIPGETKSLVDELREIRQRKSKDADREEEITTILKWFGPSSLQYNRQIVAIVQVGTSSKIDTKTLRANHPDVAKECTVAIEFLTVKVC